MNKKDIEKQIESLEQQVKDREEQIAKLKGELSVKKKPELNDLFSRYIHTWLYFPGYEDMSYLVNIHSVEEIDDSEIGFTGVVIELGTVNTNHLGIKVNVATTEYGKKYLHRFGDLPYVYSYEDDNCAQIVKKQMDGCLEEKVIEKVTVEEARDIITSHMYWSIWECTEHGILSESENPLRDFNKPYTITDKA